MSLKGIHTAIITPFLPGGGIDWKAFEKIINHQLSAGVQGIVFCGTTGESPTLSFEEKRSVFEFGFKKLTGTKTFAISGIGSNDTAETIRIGKMAESIGYRKHLVVTPYYNKPTQLGLLKHYEAISGALSGEIILYNVPGRTGVSLTAETIGTLSLNKKITAIKEATGNIGFGEEILREVKKRSGQMELLSGDDATYLSLLEVGAVGAISVASHLAPRSMVEMTESFFKGDKALAEKTNERLMPWFKDLFIESNPGPVKWVLSRLHIIQNELRLPLVPVSKKTEEQLEKLFLQDPTFLGEWK